MGLLAQETMGSMLGPPCPMGPLRPASRNGYDLYATRPQADRGGMTKNMGRELALMVVTACLTAIPAPRLFGGPMAGGPKVGIARVGPIHPMAWGAIRATLPVSHSSMLNQIRPIAPNLLAQGPVVVLDRENLVAPILRIPMPQAIKISLQSGDATDKPGLIIITDHVSNKLETCLAKGDVGSAFQALGRAFDAGSSPESTGGEGDLSEPPVSALAQNTGDLNKRAEFPKYILRFRGKEAPAQDVDKIRNLPGIKILESTRNMLLVQGDEAEIKGLIGTMPGWKMSPLMPVPLADEPPELMQIRRLDGVSSVLVDVNQGLIFVAFKTRKAYDAAYNQGMLPKTLGRYSMIYSADGKLMGKR